MTKASNNIWHLYRQAYSGHANEIWVLTLLALINRVGTMVIPFLTIYLTTVLDFSLKEAGFLSGAYGIGALVGTNLSGKLSDKYGSRPIIIVSLILAGAIMISLQWATSFYSLLTVIVIAGLFAESYRPAVMSAMGKFAKANETGRTMAMMRLAISLGMSMAPTVGGFVAITLGYDWLFWIDGLTCLASATYFWIFSSHWSDVDKPEVAGDLQNEENALPPWRNKAYMFFLLAAFFMGFCFMQWFNTVPVFIKSEWTFDERYIGILMGCSSVLIALFEMPIVHHLEKKGYIKGSILLGLVLIGLSFLPFVLPGALVLCFVAMLLWTAGMILFFPFHNALPIKMSSPDRRGDYLGWYWMTWSLTAILAPSFGFAFIELFGFVSFWVGLLVLMMVSFVMHWRMPVLSNKHALQS